MISSAKKEVGKGFYAAVGGLTIVGVLNALSLWNQSQIFKETTTNFISTQNARNEKQDIANDQFRIAIAELKQQSADQSKRLDLVENRQK